MDYALGLPLIDISKEKNRQFVVDKEKDVYIGHPTGLLLRDGHSILTIYPKCHGFGQLAMKKSKDGGKTWSKRLVVPESWSTSLEIPTLYRMADVRGKERLILFSGCHPIRTSVSEDEGNTWTELAPIGNFGGVAVMCDVVNTAPGEYAALFHDEGRYINGGKKALMEVYRTGQGDDIRTKLMTRYADENGVFGEPQNYWVQTLEREGDCWEKIHQSEEGEKFSDGSFRVYVTRTTDGGLTWSKPEMIAHIPGLELCEPGAIRSEDGKRMAVLLRENSRKGPSYYIESYDNTLTWTKPKPLPAELTGDRHVCRTLQDGRIIILYRDMAMKSPTKGDWVAWIGKYDNILNGGGEYRIRLMENHNAWDCGYSFMDILEDGTISATSYGHWTDGEQPYIVTVHFRLEEIEKKIG